MLYPIYLIKDAGLRLSNLNIAVEKCLKDTSKFSPDEILPKVYSAINDARCGVSELYFGAESKNEYRLLNQILSMCAQTLAQNGNDIEPRHLNEELTQLVDMLDGVDENTNERCYRWQVRNSMEPHTNSQISVPGEIFQKIADTMEPLGRRLNVIFLKDSEGTLPRKMRWAFASDKAVFYGANLPDSLDSTARSYYDKVALGSMRGGSITNVAFDMMVLAPRAKISISKECATIEKSAILDGVRAGLKYLRINGYLVFALPFFRLSREVCAYLARTFDDIQVLRPENGCDEDTGQVYFIGRKKDRTLDNILSNDVSNTSSYNLLREASYNVEAIARVSEMRGITIPAQAVEISSFTGSILDTAELLRVISESTASQQFWDDQNEPLLLSSDRHPLLPFSIGQLGLVTCSGCLDGVVEEGDNCCHLVKGRVVKYTEVENSQEGTKTKISTTESNRVEINILTPDGEHKILA